MDVYWPIAESPRPDRRDPLIAKKFDNGETHASAYASHRSVVRWLVDPPPHACPVAKRIPEQTMGLAGRVFLIDDQDGLYRLPNAVFVRMLENPTEEPLPRFSGARVRMADLILTLRDRRPDRIVHATFSILHFDNDGCLIASEFDRQQRALADVALSAAMEAMAMPGGGSANVLDATSRFVARGGAWTPKDTLLRRIFDAALDLGKYSRPQIICA